MRSSVPKAKRSISTSMYERADATESDHVSECFSYYVYEQINDL